MRLDNPRLNAFLVRQFGSLLRPEEAHGGRVPSAFFFLLGAGLSVLCFPSSVASLALLHLSVADPVAALGGEAYGSRALWGVRGKTLEGAAAAFVASLVTGVLFLVTVHDCASQLTAGLALALGLAGSIGELLPFGDLDDNLTLPLVSGLILLPFAVPPWFLTALAAGVANGTAPLEVLAPLLCAAGGPSVPSTVA